MKYYTPVKRADWKKYHAGECWDEGRSSQIERAAIALGRHGDPRAKRHCRVIRNWLYVWGNTSNEQARERDSRIEQAINA